MLTAVSARRLRRLVESAADGESWLPMAREVLEGTRSVEDAVLHPALREGWSDAARKAALEARRAKHSGGLRRLFTDKEHATHRDPTLLRQPAADLDTVYKHSERIAPLHEKVLKGVGRELGGGLVGHHEVAKHGPTKGITFVGPLKKKDRAQAKVTHEYGGDAGSITDIVRGSVSVPHVKHIPHAVEVLRKHANENGFDIVKPKNRIVHEKGSLTNRGATPQGYRDANVLLRHRDSGTLSEVQIHAHPYLHAKDTVGHALYVEHSALVRRYGSRPPERIVKRLAALEGQMKAAYAEAHKKATE